MKCLFLLLGLLYQFALTHAQTKLSRNMLIKMVPLKDSASISKEKLSNLSSTLNAAVKDRTNILIISQTLKDTKDQQVSLIAGMRRREAYKVNLPAVVSKHIGETEKNLELLFASAASNQWILFFDEADKLFSNSREPESTANAIQKLSLEKKVMSIFWCEDDCLNWLGRSKYVLIE